jgi:glycosyltransferase involved in cell wall biosynthesis
MASDFNMHLIYVQADDEQKEKFQLSEKKVEGLHEQIVYFKGATGPLKKIINARRYKEAQLLAYTNIDTPIDLCHIHVPYRSGMLALHLLKKGIPMVITEHWSGHLTGIYSQKNDADKILYKKFLRKGKTIATVSKLLQEKFKENTGFDSVVIPNLIESTPIEKEKTKSESIQILSVSDLDDSTKNISGLLRAFRAALQSKQNLHLTIIGGGPDEKKVADLIRELKIEHHTTLKGRLPHKEVLENYQLCDFYVCNSNYETFGMTVAEALLSGKPVICTQCGGPEEFLSQDNSIVIETDKQEEMTNAILEMSNTYTTYYSPELIENIETKFGRDTIKNKLSEFYLSAIND